MCGICGCSDGTMVHDHHDDHGNHKHEPANLKREHDQLKHEHDDHKHEHNHHNHDHKHDHHHENLIPIEQAIFAKNNEFAAHNRQYFIEKNVLALNFMSSPGAGKTTLLAKTIADLKAKTHIAVIVGDQQTDYDAELLRVSGAPAIQVNTGRVCHLDAHSVGHALSDLSITSSGILFIENVGNLVCPALFDLGEKFKVVILSVTEGDNKPLKYPDMFHSADLVIITKMDLLPYVQFDLDKCMEYTRHIQPDIDIITLSATTGEGLNEWYNWLCEKHVK